MKRNETILQMLLNHLLICKFLVDLSSNITRLKNICLFHLILLILIKLILIRHLCTRTFRFFLRLVRLTTFLLVIRLCYFE